MAPPALGTGKAQLGMITRVQAQLPLAAESEEGA
jgi:hypothetical protein